MREKHLIRSLSRSAQVLLPGMECLLSYLDRDLSYLPPITYPARFPALRVPFRPGFSALRACGLPRVITLSHTRF
jgi:hypothetical protein